MCPIMDDAGPRLPDIVRGDASFHDKKPQVVGWAQAGNGLASGSSQRPSATDRRCLTRARAADRGATSSMNAL